MRREDWDEDALLGKIPSLSAKTVRRVLAGNHCRKSTAELIAKALEPYTTEPLFEGNGIVPSRRPVPVPEAVVSEAALADLYRACDRAPFALKEHIRVRDFAHTIRERTREFVGRAWLFDALDAFTQRQPRGYFVLWGMPGVGKTAFAAAVVQRRGCVHHFNSRLTRVNRADQFLGSVCGQLIAAYLPGEQLPARATRDAGTLSDLLARAVHAAPGQKLLLVIDALDEAEHEPGVRSNPLALPPDLPHGVYVVLTTRAVDATPRFECPFHSEYLEQGSDENGKNIREFVERRSETEAVRGYLRRQNLSGPDFVRLLEERSQGNFMYLRCVLPEIESGRYAGREWRDLPLGLTSYYESHWQLLRDENRADWVGYKLPVLRVLFTAGPVSLDLLAARVAGASRDAIREVIRRDWRQFLEEVDLTVAGRPVRGWRLYHPSFADFLQEKDKDPAEGVGLEAERDAWFADAQARGYVPD